MTEAFDNKSLKDKILDGTMEVFKQKGMKFTMDDVAKELKISKKTIYTIFPDKESMFLAMVDYLFDGIKDSERKVLENDSLDTVSKIKQVLGVMPESYKNLDFGQLYLLRDKFPAIYERVEERLESGWENILALMQQGVEEGVIRPVSLPLVKMMLEASLEQFFQRDILIRNHLSYAEALNQVVSILVDGIKC